ncbi:O-antigen ligase family protein [Paenibacillus yonginensis]|uniref:O-antigen ligase family protein n=1 Tax=Paenibacillus yonginensis TaxID=1462996 RepID=UPI0009F1D1AE|nr:O-antigen ligase family protein [Paenibacillus yonginensis]
MKPLDSLVRYVRSRDQAFWLTVAAWAACTLLPFAIGSVSAKLSPALSQQGLLLLLLLFPAFLLALNGSKYLVTYTLFVWAIGPEIRRISDWLGGEYTSVSVLSLAPLLASSMTMIPVLRGIHRMEKSGRKVLLYFGAALLYGSVIGLARNGTSFVYDLANYAIPMLLLPFFAIRRFSSAEADNILSGYANIAVLVSVYGIVQYLVVPPWDAFWMTHVEMNSIGLPEPLEVRVFSTLNSPGPAAGFLACALVPMVLEKRWRGSLGWIGVLLVAFCLLTTLVRSSWLMIIVMLLVYIASSPSRRKWRTLLQLAVVALVLTWALPKLPGAEGLTARMQTLGSIEEDHSYNERLDLLNTMLPTVLHNPAGQGIGSVGTGTKLGNDGELGEYGIMDNGFLALLLTFGIAGGLCFFGALGLVGRSVIVSVLRKGTMQLYARLALAVWAGAVASLFSDNGFPGLRGYLIWMLIGIGLGAGSSAADRKEESYGAVQREVVPRQERIQHVRPIRQK